MVDGRQLVACVLSMSLLDRFAGFTYALTGSAPRLAGIWQRTGDNFAGCTVAISAGDGQVMNGFVTALPIAMQRCGWKIGDKKWTDFEPRGRTTWAVYDLAIEFNIERQAVANHAYVAATIDFVSDDRFTLNSHRFSSIKWVRVGRS